MKIILEEYGGAMLCLLFGGIIIRLLYGVILIVSSY